MAEDTGQADFTEYLKQPIFFPDDFKDWVADWFATNVPKLHVSQIFGFKLQSVKSAPEISLEESVSDTSYAAFSTDGPLFDHVPPGFYLLFFGAQYEIASNTPAFQATFPNLYIVPRVDGVNLTDGDACVLNAGSNGRVTLLDLSGPAGEDPDHTITFWRKVDAAGTVYVRYRWAYLIKVVTDD